MNTSATFALPEFYKTGFFSSGSFTSTSIEFSTKTDILYTET